jgi:hypothetical protein
MLENFLNPNLNIGFSELLVRVISFLNSPELQSWIFPIKVGFLAASGLLAGVIIFILLATHYLNWLFVEDLVQFFTRKPYGTKKITKAWGRVVKRLEGGAESEYKLAIIEADSMFDASLKRLGYLGATMEERMQKLAPATLPNISQVREAHQTRNNIVHDPDYRLTADEAKRTLNVYEQAFKYLQILE